MIDIHISIRQKPTVPGKIGAVLEADIDSKRPTKEEVSVAARVMDKLREIANDISKELDANVTIEERIVDVRHYKPKSDRYSDGNSGSGPAKGSPEGESGGSSPPKD